MNIVDAVLAQPGQPLPPIQALGYDYVLASNGLFIRAEDSRMEAMIPIASARLHGLAEVKPFARLKLPRVPGAFLWSVWASARRRMPNEVLYQFRYDSGQWRCAMPPQIATPVTLEADDGDGEAVIDLHSHGAMAVFFSQTDDDDEQGFRFYAVIGRLDNAPPGPEIRVRVGVYGHHWDVPLEIVFDGRGPFADMRGQPVADEAGGETENNEDA